MKRFFYVLSTLFVMVTLVACQPTEETPVDETVYYDVTFNSNGGSGVTSVEVAENGLVTKPMDPTRDGYSFDGWYKEASLETAWVFGTDVVTADLTLYAKWTEVLDVFTVTFDSNGGSVVSDASVTEGELLTEPADPTKAGFTFDGWYKEAELTNAWVFDTGVVSASITLYAKWIATVSFDTNEGTTLTALEVNPDQTIDRPEDPTRAGFVFAGWYKDEAMTELFAFETDQIASDTTLYAKWKQETDFGQTFKILSIGNSFSEDAHKYLWSIAQSYGIPAENIVIANMYIGGAELVRHITNINTDSAAYTYQLYEDATVEVINGVALSQAIRAEAWDVVTFQQASHHSGLPATYADYVLQLTEFVEEHATNPNVQIMWHMTWAYQQTSTHSGFANYSNDQMTMYQAILDTVEAKIHPVSQVQGVIPSGTAIQNARTSYIGDLFTRDGYHLSDPLGRYIAALTFFKAITGFDLTTQTVAFAPNGVSETMQGLAYEAVNNAFAKPYEVTNSTFTTEPDPDPIEVNGVAYTFDYVQGFWNTNATAVSPSTDALYNSFAAVMPIPKYMFPAGSEIVLADGYQYRIIFFNKVGETYQVALRTDMYQLPYLVIDETLWSTYDYIGFNITTNPTSDISSRLAEVAGKLSLYHPEGTGQGHVDDELTWQTGRWEVAANELTASVNHISSNPLTPAFYDYDTVVEVAAGYKFAYVVLEYAMGEYTVTSVSDYQTASLYIDQTFATDKPLIAFIVTTTDENVDLSAQDISLIIDMHPQLVPHMDTEMSFISGYWELGKNSITTTNANMTFLNGFAASQPQSKHYYESVNSITIEAGYQVRVIYLTYDGFGNYQVALRTNNLTGTIVLDETFWSTYEYVAFNISAVPAQDLSGSLESLPGKFSYDVDPVSFELGYWNTNGTQLTASTTFAGSNVIPRQLMPTGSVLTIEAGYQIRLVFLTYTQENGYKVVSRTENFVGTIPLTHGLYKDYEYIAFNISTVPSTNLTDTLATLPSKIVVSTFSEPLVDHVDQALSFVVGYWNDYAIAVTTGDTTFIKGFAASNVLSKASLSDVTSIVVEAGYQVRVIYMDFSYNTYTVMLRTDNLTGTITLDETFWQDYAYIAFNISSVPSSDLSGVLETLPPKLTFVNAA